MNQENSMGIGVLSERTGCKVGTIRYYEQIGLLPDPPRSEGGHRIYSLEHLKRLTFIRRGRELGFTLDEIRTLLGLVDGGSYTCGEVKALTLEHLQEIHKKITDLKRLEESLTAIAAECEGGAASKCPIVDALFKSR